MPTVVEHAMKQSDARQDEEGAGGRPGRCWLRVAMGMAGACALLAQAALELSALETPDPSYAAQPAPPACTPPCSDAPTITIKG
ncbi:hypothetical protein [Massilia suwonensis]|uniref:Uncharacterized protein n=1 Tax=Massilia suwonensis TaxID=648895 RepID=A0ABW0MT29_9BURK